MSARVSPEEITRDDAAKKIQRAWKAYQDKCFFRKLKDLITFRSKCDPQSLLKVINPREAQLLDPSVGAHVRFRLVGIEWPPQIYYKIFLHSPVCDLNSFAPRNYIDPKSKEVPIVSSEELPKFADKYGWYKRFENNGWRPVANGGLTVKDYERKTGGKAKRKITNRDVATLKVKRYLQGTHQEDEIPDLSGINDEELFRWADSLELLDDPNDWKTLGTTGPSSNLWWVLNSDSDDENSFEEEDIDTSELLKLLQ